MELTLLVYTIGLLLFMGVGVVVGYYLYAPSDYISPKEIPAHIKDKLKKKGKAGVARIPSAEKLNKMNDPLREDKEAVAQTIMDLQKEDVEEDYLTKIKNIIK